MKYIKLYLSALLIILVLSGLNAQEVIPVAGGNAEGAGGSVSYTIGQIMYHTYTGSNGSLAEGIQQPYEISILTGSEEIRGIDLISSVYPNPVSEFLTLRVEELEIPDLKYQLLDVNGRLLENNMIKSRETIINMERLTAGIYFLIVTDNNKDLKTFKIIKY